MMRVGGEPYYALPSRNGFFQPYNAATKTFSRFPHVSRTADGSHVTDPDQGKLTTIQVTAEGKAEGKTARGKSLRPVGEGHGDVDATGRRLYGRGNDTNKIVPGATQDPGTGEPLSPRTVVHVGAGGTHRLAGAFLGPVERTAFTPELIAAADVFGGRFVPIAPAPAAAPRQPQAPGAAASASSAGGVPAPSSIGSGVRPVPPAAPPGSAASPGPAPAPPHSGGGAAPHGNRSDTKKK